MCGFIVSSFLLSNFVVIRNEMLKKSFFLRTNTTSLSTVDCIKKVWNNEGLRGFYRGLTASYAGIVETVVYFTIYEQLKVLYSVYYELDTSINFMFVFAGCLCTETPVRPVTNHQNTKLDMATTWFNGHLVSIEVHSHLSCLPTR